MLKIGIIGTGGMAGGHAQMYSKIKGVTVSACCDISADRAAAFARRWGIPRVYTGFTEMLDQERLDAVSNVTPDRVHAPVALAVLKRRIHLLSEKPLATTLVEARQMAAAARKAGVINMVHFTYRNSAGLLAAARVVESGKLGRIIHVESSYLQSWLVSNTWGNWKTAPGWMWRLSTRHGSGGTLYDLGCHIYDMTCLLAGDLTRIDCRLKTFDKCDDRGRKIPRIGEYVFDANDSFFSNVEFAGGALGTVHSTRWATGQINSLRTRVWGDQGAIEVDLDASYDRYKIFLGAKKSAGWQTVPCKPVPNLIEKFIKAIKTGKNDASDFENGKKIQAYLHYSELSNKLQKPVRVKL